METGLKSAAAVIMLLSAAALQSQTRPPETAARLSIGTGGIRGREGGVMAAKSMTPVEEVRSEASGRRTLREWLGGAIKVTLLTGGLLGMENLGCR